jgi:hypothetical protein
MSGVNHKVVLHVEDFTQLKGIPFLREVIILSYIMNTIRSSQRFLLLNEEQPNGPAKSRDTIFGLITTSSFVYESLKTAAGILKQVGPSLPRELHAEIAWVINEEKDDSSLYKTTLANIRNRIAFHFNLQIGDDTLKAAVQHYPPVFEEGSSNRTIDSAYVLADEVITQLFAQCDPSDGIPEEKVIRLLEQLSKYNVRLCEVLDNVIAHLIADRAEGLVGANCT